MDLWVVAATAGAGYAAKHWHLHNVSARTKGAPSESFSLSSDLIHRQARLKNLLQHIRESPFHGISSLAQVGDSDAFEELFWGFNHLHDGDGIDGRQGVATTGSGGFYYHEGERPTDLSSYRHRRFKVLSLVSSQPSSVDYEHPHEVGVIINAKDAFDDSLTANESSAGNRFHWSRNFMAVYPEHYVLTPIIWHAAQLSDNCARTEGIESGVHSSSPSDLYLERENERMMNKKGDLEQKEIVLGNLQLPSLGKWEPELPRRWRRRTDERSSVGSSISAVSAFTGSFSGMLLFFLGLKIGASTQVTANKSEFDTVGERLKLTRNLVQDLQEELEMEDRLTVKEIHAKGSLLLDAKPSCEPDGTRTATAFSPAYERDYSSKSCTAEPHNNIAEKSDAMSKIEAELEAEFERLELSMKLTGFENFGEGDLGLKKHDGHIEGSSNSDSNTSGTSEDLGYSSNYTVSPHDLSSRLHQLIESRLEDRIAELEAALEASQKKLQFLLLESMQHQTDSFSEISSSSPGQEDWKCTEKIHRTSKSYMENLPCEEVDAYMEAYEDITSLTNADEAIQMRMQCNAEHMEIERHSNQKELM